MNTTPELGFEYFPSPETGDDQERIAYAFLYCSVAVKEWPKARRRLIKAGLKSAEQCDHIEAHAISIFRETGDRMLLAMETDDLGLMADARGLERFTHAHALLASFADPKSLPEYRDMVFPNSESQPAQRDFNLALWEAGWDTRDGSMPTQVTRKRAVRHRHLRKMDGLYNSRLRHDAAANAGVFDERVAEGPPLLLKEQSEVIEREIKSLIRQLRAVAKRAGLKPAQITFLVEMAVHGRQQKDNPSAWRAIRSRKRSALYPEIQRLVRSVRELRQEIIPSSIK